MAPLFVGVDRLILAFEQHLRIKICQFCLQTAHKSLIETGILQFTRIFKARMTEPIILIGAARSGTKFLRDTLAQSAGAKCVPYDVNYVWRFGNEKHPHDALSLQELDDKKKTFIRKTLRSLAKIDRTDTRTALIEKTVSNTLRLPFIQAVYPNARFIHLTRDGRAVTESAMRLWEAPPDWPALWKKFREMPLSNLEYAIWFATNQVKGLVSRRGGGQIWGPRYPGIEADLANYTLLEICSLQWLHSVQYTLKDLPGIPASQVYTVRYEDLVRDETAITNLCEFLDFPDTDEVVSAFKAKVKLGQNDKWRDKVSPENCERMTEIMHDGLRQLGFLEE